MLNLFYEEPDPDRWLPGDHHPRRWIRRLFRGPRRPGGQERVFLNLLEGLKELRLPHRVNDYRWAVANPSAPVGIVGKPWVLDKIAWRNPILFGASVMSHPLADPDLPKRRPLKRVLVPGEWNRDMFAASWGDLVRTWPVGIDTRRWTPNAGEKSIDVLLYDKVRWNHDAFESSLLEPIRTHLRQTGLSFAEIRYGYYREEEFHQLLRRSHSMVFVCEHETQGIAYQQALSCDVPICAWDRGGDWQDPEYYPEHLRYGPVSSVPYWDSRCGEKFVDARDFPETFDLMWNGTQAKTYSPRNYILENLTLAKCARKYVEHWRETFGEGLIRGV